MTLEFIILYVALPTLSLAFGLAFIRLTLGPSLPDRVVALELMSTFAIGLTVLYAVLTNQPALLDVAIVIALISFLGTVSFAYYLQRRVQG